MTSEAATAGRRCPRCAAALGRASKFCGACGAVTTEHRTNVRAARDSERREAQRATLAVAIVFAGTLAGLVAAAHTFEDHARALELTLLGSFAAQFAVGALALAVLGRGAHRAALGRWPSLPLALAAVPIGALAFVVALGWVRLLPGSGEVPAEALGPWATLALVLGAPLVEEWLDRGVLWRALAPLTSERGRIVTSAVLFGLAHGLNGGFLLEFPHRFAGGLALGALRSRSDSLVPSFVAHVTWNTLAVTLVP